MKNYSKKWGKKGAMATWLLTVIIVSSVLIGALLIGSGYTYLNALTKTAVVIDYDGEFDDAYLATQGNFYSDFTEGTDCNITSDVLGGAAYTACVYDTTQNIGAGATTNATTYRLDLVIDIDNDVEDLEIEGTLQNTGTGQAADDLVIETAELWTYDDADEAILVYEIPIDNEDDQLEGNTGILAGDDYVLHVVLKTLVISPAFANGDDIMRIDLDLTTDGDVDAARITLEE